jgi:hypothetical protein
MSKPFPRVKLLDNGTVIELPAGLDYCEKHGLFYPVKKSCFLCKQRVKK